MPILGSAADLAAAAAAVPGNPNFEGLQPVGSHTNMAHIGTGSDASNSASYLVRHVVAVDTRTIALVYSNTVQGTADGANAITIKAALRRSDTSLLPLTFGGQPSVTLQPGCDAMTDPVTCPVTAGDYLQTITYVGVTSGTWPLNVKLSRVYPLEGFAAGSDRTRDFSGTWDTANRSAFGPTLVLGTATSATKPVIGVEGDSITVGEGDTTYYSHWERGLTGLFSHALIGNGGQTANQNKLFFTVQRRLRWLAGCTHLICAYGPNDVAGGATAAATAAGMQTFWQTRASLGARVYQATIPPNTTSTDSWATAGNQTVKSFEAVRVQVNDWLRGGAKVDGSGTPVFDGSGTASSYLSGVVEIADAFETARNSGKWKSPGYTADGIHPSTTGYTAATATVTAWANALG